MNDGVLWTMLVLAAASPVRLGYVVELPEHAVARDVDATFAEVIAERTGVELLSRTVFDTSEARTCGADVACLARELRYDSADYVALVAGAEIDGRLRLIVRLIDTQGAKIVAREARTAAAPADDALRESLDALLDAIGVARLGRLSVLPASIESKVTVEDERGATVATGLGPHALPPGRYRVRAVAAERAPFDEAVTLEGGRVVSVALDFAAPPSAPWYTSPWFWVVTAGVVVSGALVGAAVVSAGSDRCVCIGRDVMSCPPPC